MQPFVVLINSVELVPGIQIAFLLVK